jgi:hypothetical protein
MPFIDRDDAGRRLAKALTRYKDRKPDCSCLLSLPRATLDPLHFFDVVDSNAAWRLNLHGVTSGLAD